MFDLQSPEYFTCTHAPQPCKMLRIRCIQRQAKAQQAAGWFATSNPDTYGICFNCKQGQSIAGVAPEPALVETNRRCTVCGETKPLILEYFRLHNRDKFDCTCKVCRNAQARERYQRRKEK